ncbi:hypothetical protein V12B01_07678 [Vibrio splendidus 12B01]|nr:hypothetical protein V12B01_07678 [Vibrio splendidus 12B01]
MWVVKKHVKGPKYKRQCYKKGRNKRKESHLTRKKSSLLGDLLVPKKRFAL